MGTILTNGVIYVADISLDKQHSLSNYFREISEINLLSPEEEIELAKRIKQNDLKALKKLVNANLRFVVSVAKNYQNHGLSLEDLINEGDRKLAESIVREMELFEEELLRNGITERTAERLNRIQQQLMRLENAALEQGERKERESRTNTEIFANPILTRPEVFERKWDEIEFLNRQVLPLRRLYQDRVKRYFSKSD